MYIKLINRVLLGLLMLVPGLMKLFVMGPSAVTGMLSGLGFPAASFFAWILILSEIIFGLAILARWKLHYTVWPPIVIMVVAGIATLVTAGEVGVPIFLLHLVAATSYLMLRSCWCCGGMTCDECACTYCDEDSMKSMKSPTKHPSKHKKR